MINKFGWTEALARGFETHAARGYLPARVLIQFRGFYLLATDHGELRAQLAGRIAQGNKDAAYPAVGDWVAVAMNAAQSEAIIHAVLPRRSAFTRRAAGSEEPQVVAANIDVALILTSMNAEFNPRRLERYVAAAWESGAQPVIVLTKVDLCDDPDRVVVAAMAAAPGVPVIPISTLTGAGMTALDLYLKPGETCVLVGSSGVGKSSLANALAGRDILTTGATRASDAKGRHTTTHRELVALPGGALVLDTPGMRELGLVDAQGGVARAFEDVEALFTRCRFSDFGHTNEPGCAVTAALGDGELDEKRLGAFLKLKREATRETSRNDPEMRKTVRKGWARVTQQMRQRRRFQDG